jgi:hypothetical protein
MASPLTAALLGGNDNSNATLLGLDPSLLNAGQDIQTGQAIENQALSTAPAPPGASLARALMAIPGAYIKSQATGDLAKAYAGSAAKLSEAFDPDDPIQKFLKSDSLPAKMIGIQAAKQALILKSEPYTLGPTDTRQINGAPIGSGSPKLAGQTAGAQAQARAPYESGGDVTVQTPTGPQVIPATAATRAAIQPPMSPPRPGSGPTPSAAIPPPPPKPEATTGNSQSGAPQLLGGKPLENPLANNLAQSDAKEVAADREAALKGQQDMANIRMIQDFLPKVATGWSGESKLEAARVLKAIGVPNDSISDFMRTDVASGQILQKKFLELSAGAARNMGAREPGSVIQMFAKAYPNLGTDQNAIKLQTNALHMDRLRQQQLAQEKTNFLNDSVNGYQSTGQYRGLKGFNELFNAAHPVESYLHAAEAMSGAPEAWARINPKDYATQNQIIRNMPPNTYFLAPDNKWHVTPGAGTPTIQLTR